MGTLNNALTRIGAGGPSINYTRPFTAKGETLIVAVKQLVGFLRDVGRVGRF